MSKEFTSGHQAVDMDTFLHSSPEMDRRRLLQLGARAALVGASAHLIGELDDAGLDRRYGNWHGSHVADFLAVEDAPQAKEAWLVFKGMGTDSGAQAAERLGGILPQRTPIAWMEYDPGWVDIPDVAHNLAGYRWRMHQTNPDMRLSFLDLSAGNAIEKGATYHLMEQENIALCPHREILASNPWSGEDICGEFERKVSSALAWLTSNGFRAGWLVSEIGGLAQVVRDSVTSRRLPRSPLGGPANLSEFLAMIDLRAEGSQPTNQWLALNEAIHRVKHYEHLASLAISREQTHTMVWCSDNDRVVEMPRALESGLAVYKAAQLPKPAVCHQKNAGHANTASVALDTTIRTWIRETSLPSDPVWV